MRQGDDNITQKKEEKYWLNEEIIEPEKPWQPAFSIISMNLLSCYFTLDYCQLKIYW